MAFIRTRSTGKVDKRGEPILSYQVVWREPVRDDFGVPTGQHKQTSETFPTEKTAKARQRSVETDLETAKGVDPSSQRAKANKPLGEYAREYFDSLAGQIDSSTIDGYEKIYRTHIAAVFGSRPVVSITTADVARFRVSLLAPSSSRRIRCRSTRAAIRVSREISPAAPGGRRTCKASTNRSSASFPCWSWSSAGPRRSTIRVTPSESRNRARASHTPAPRYLRVILPCCPIRNGGLPGTDLPVAGCATHPALAQSAVHPAMLLRRRCACPQRIVCIPSRSHR